jgi:hypothetical protein
MLRLAQHDSPFGSRQQAALFNLVLPFGITVTYFRNAIKLPGQAPWH